MRRLLLLMPAFACALLLVPAARTGAHAAGGAILVFASGDVVITDLSGRHTEHVSMPGAVTDVTPSRDGARFAYRSIDADNHWSLTVADRSGGHRWTLTRTAIEDVAPVWSPDGRQLAYVSAGPAWLAVIRGHRKLLLDPVGGGMEWSPDGRTLAFSGSAGLVLVDGATHRRKVIVHGNVDQVAWTPDSRTVVYRANGRRVFAIDVAGGQTRRPWLIVDRAGGFGLSPDGRTLVFDRHNSLFTVPFDGSRLPRLIASDYFEYAWSPDSTRLAFSRRHAHRHGAAGIFVVPRAGGAPHLLLSGIGNDGARNPSWSPDGRRIEYRRSEGGWDRGYIVNADGTDNRPLLPDDPDAIPWSEVSWLGGSIPLPPSPSTVTPIPAVQAETNAPVVGLIADGYVVLAVTSYPVDEVTNTWNTAFWSPSTGTRAETGTPCGGDLTGVALAGDRYAEVCTTYDVANSLEVYTGLAGQTLPTTPTLTNEGDGRLASVAGHGRLLVATLGGDLFRLDPGAPPTVIRHYQSAAVALSVDDDRVLVAPTRTAVEVVAADGTVIASFPAAHQYHALLRDDRVITLAGEDLVVRDFSGQTVLERTLPADAELEDVSGDLVLYTSKSRLHLRRLSDDRDVTLRLPGQTARAHASFADDGIVYAYNAFDPEAHRLGLIRAADANALLR